LGKPSNFTDGTEERDHEGVKKNKMGEDSTGKRGVGERAIESKSAGKRGRTKKNLL